jgi:hypothetical protein
MINMDWLWFRQHGFTREQYAFATARQPDWRDAPPPGLESVIDVVTSPTPGLTAEQVEQATGRYSLAMNGGKLPHDWPVKSVFDDQPELTKAAAPEAPAEAPKE